MTHESWGNLDNTGEDLLMTLMTTGEDLLMTLMTTGEDLLMTLTTTGEDLLTTHDDDTDENYDANVLGSH